VNTLTTTLCTLEPQVEAHAAEMFSVLCDPAIYQFEGEPPPSVERLATGYRRKEARVSPDGSETWLNWVVRLKSGELAGYVQATVTADGRSLVGYEFASRFWRQGLATSALQAMFAELARHYAVSELIAVLKAANFRSMGLLRKLGFVEVPVQEQARFEPEADETVMRAGIRALPSAAQS
jgi:[ribosomal protein S5]-alanine N-acetyltransferase